MTHWRKSSHSGGGSADHACVELAELDGRIGIRDSKHPTSAHLTVAPAALAVLTRRIKAGELDR
jgi:hypothetical protein